MEKEIHIPHFTLISLFLTSLLMILYKPNNYVISFLFSERSHPQHDINNVGPQPPYHPVASLRCMDCPTTPEEHMGCLAETLNQDHICLLTAETENTKNSFETQRIPPKIKQIQEEISCSKFPDQTACQNIFKVETPVTNPLIHGPPSRQEGMPAQVQSLQIKNITYKY